MEQNEVSLTRQLESRSSGLPVGHLARTTSHAQPIQGSEKLCGNRLFSNKTPNMKTRNSLDDVHSSSLKVRVYRSDNTLLKSYPTRTSSGYDIGIHMPNGQLESDAKQATVSISPGNQTRSKVSQAHKWISNGSVQSVTRSRSSAAAFGRTTRFTSPEQSLNQTFIAMPMIEIDSLHCQPVLEHQNPNFRKSSIWNLLSISRKRQRTQPEDSNGEGGRGELELEQVYEMPIEKIKRSVSMPDSNPFADLSFSVSDNNQWRWTVSQGRMKGKDSYFNDGKRLIDLVLPYQPHTEAKLRTAVHNETLRRRYRQQLMESLKASGLQIEEETLCHAEDGKTCFIKIHATWDFLSRNAEYLQMQMPFYNVEQLKHKLKVMRFYIQSGGKKIMASDDLIAKSNILPQAGNSIFDKICMALNGGRHPFRIDQFAIPDTRFKQLATFDRRRLDMFDDASDDQRVYFFTVNQRSRLVHEILERTTLAKVTIDETQQRNKKAKGEQERVSFYQLLGHDVFRNPMVLHDDDTAYQIGKDRFENTPIKYLPYRRWLTDYWGSFAYPWRKFQPLDEIWRYFGVKTSLYFAWMGFYTTYLCLPAFVAALCLIYGIYTVFSDEITVLYCDINGTWANRTTCRLCPSLACPYHLMWHSCVYSRLSLVFDNKATVFFAAFTALWAVVFLEKWKTRQAFLVAHWHAKNDFTDDVERAQYDKKAKQDTQLRILKWQRANAKYHESSMECPDEFPPGKNPWYKNQARLIDPVTGEDKLWPSQVKSHVTTSLLIVTFFLTIIIGFMGAIVVYRMVAGSLFGRLDNNLIKWISPSMFTSVSASIVNVIVIYVGTVSYTAIAWKLTEYETHRTDGQFETSYTYKMFIFQFFNYYGSLLYLALLKGKFTHPNPYYQRTHLADSCPHSGCLTQVSIQLIVIMTGKQVLNNVVEIGGPFFRKWIRNAKRKQPHGASNGKRQWEKDFILNEVTKPYHFDDYMELVIQYGFIVMFAPAFPPGAILALLNNILEIRIDGSKLLKDFRRPIPIQGDTIGAWMPILEILTKLAIVVNGAVIALSSEIVDKTIHAALSDLNSPEEYLDHVFSTFHTADYQIDDPIRKQLLRVDQSTNETVEACLFRGYFHSHGESTPYLKNDLWWRSFMIKIIFVMVFEHLMFMIHAFLQVFIPDVPVKVQQNLKEANLMERRTIHFLDKEGGREQFADLRKKVEEIALHPNRRIARRRTDKDSCSAGLDTTRTKTVTWHNKKLNTVHQAEQNSRTSRMRTFNQFKTAMDISSNSVRGPIINYESTRRNKSRMSRSSSSKRGSTRFTQSLPRHIPSKKPLPLEIDDM